MQLLIWKALLVIIDNDTNTSAEAIVSDTNIDIPIEDIHVIIDNTNIINATVNVCNTNEDVPIDDPFSNVETVVI
jgi:hypothetical protein